MIETTASGFGWRKMTLLGVVLAIMAVVALQPPIPQEPGYHAFADTRNILGIPNGLNVLSNLAFVMVGIVGLWWLIRFGRQQPVGEYLPRLLLFVGVLLTGFGSAWYHLAPSNETLLWDRLPMTIVFTMFFAILAGDRIDHRLTGRLWLPLLLVGIASVIYWYLGERAGHGDLRPYFIVQFAPMLLAPLVVLLYPIGRIRRRDFWAIIVLYLVAKIVEIGDAAIFDLGHLASGHTLKHLFAAAATAMMLPIVAPQKSEPATTIAPDAVEEFNAHG